MTMYRLFPDTYPCMEALQIELLRNAPGGRKPEMVANLSVGVFLNHELDLLYRKLSTFQ